MKLFHPNNIKLSDKATSRLLTLNGNGMPIKLLVEKLLEDILNSEKYDEILRLLEVSK